MVGNTFGGIHPVVQTGAALEHGKTKHESTVDKGCFFIFFGRLTEKVRGSVRISAPKNCDDLFRGEVG